MIDGCEQYIPANTRHSPNVIVMLGQRCRRWTNITATFGLRLVFAGYPTGILKQHCINDEPA